MEMTCLEKRLDQCTFSDLGDLADEQRVGEQLW